MKRNKILQEVVVVLKSQDRRKATLLRASVQAVCVWMQRRRQLKASALNTSDLQHMQHMSQVAEEIPGKLSSIKPIST